jgi:hypothetical protein
MKKRNLLLIGAVEAIMLLVGVYFEPTFCVRGHLHGEAFFDGKPTSYWRSELERWDLSGSLVYVLDDEPAMTPPTTHRIPMYSWQPSWFEQMQERWLGQKSEKRDWTQPELLRGDVDAEPVLRELLDDSSPQISQFARIGLGIDPEYPRPLPLGVVGKGRVSFLLWK